MAGKTLINGTAYTIKGGKTLIGGTAYSIKKGKTLIGGTANTISFAPSFRDVVQYFVSYGSSSTSRNSSTLGTMQKSWTRSSTAITYYVFNCVNGYVSITKLVMPSNSVGGNGTFTRLSGNESYTSTGGGGYYTTTMNSGQYAYMYASYDGSTSAQLYGGLIYAFRVNTGTCPYTEAQIDAALSSVTLTRLAGINSGVAGQVSATISPSQLILAYRAGTLAISSSNGSVHYWNSDSYLVMNGNVATIGSNGTVANVYGGGIIVVTEN